MATAEDQSNASSNLGAAVQAAEKFEKEHYGANPKGETEEVDAGDFKDAGNKAAGAISDAATAVKEAVIGPSSPQAEQPASDSTLSATPAASSGTPAEPVAAESDGPSLATKIQDGTAATLDSLQHAVEPSPDEKQDPEVREFRSLVGEVFANMKESIQSGTATAQQGGDGAVGGVREGADAAASTAAHKPVANSPAEEQKGFLAMVKEAGALVADKFMPDAHAVGERSPGEKWNDAKGEAREGGRELNQAARDAASAAGHKTQYAADRTAEETRRAANRTAEKTQNAAEETDSAIRGGAQEIGDLTRGAADRVQHDWRNLKEGTRNQLADASATREYEAKHAPPKEEGGIIQSVTNAIRSVLPGGHPQDKAQETADQAKAKADSASDTLSAKTQEAKDEARGYKEKTKEEANRLGDEVKETYRDAKDTVHEKTQAAEDYLTADMRPRDEVEAATSHGEIPSNTQDVTASTEPSRAVRP